MSEVAAVFVRPVVPVVDYEPPAFGGPPVLPPVTALATRPVAGRPQRDQVVRARSAHQRRKH